MKILVTGAAGYLGSVLVGELLERHSVIAFDDLSCGSDSLVRYAGHACFRFVRGDVRDAMALRDAVRDVDAIVHLAAVVGMPACDKEPDRAKTVNVDATRLLMRMRSKDQRVVFPNTNSGYGTTAPGTVCTEDTPLSPVSLYGRLKAEAEANVLDGENTVSLRLATVFGLSPRMRRDLLVNDFVWRALRDRRIEVYEGAAMRNYCHVRDVARAIRLILPAAVGEIDRKIPDGAYNFGNDELNLSKQDLAQVIGAAISRLVDDGRHAISVFSGAGADPDQRDYMVSSAKLARLGVVAGAGLDEGIRELIAGYRCLPEFYA